MAAVMIQLPEEMLQLLGDSAESDLRFMAAVQLYKQGRVSSGRAAELAGTVKPIFLDRLFALGIPAYELTPEQLREDVENARCL